VRVAVLGERERLPCGTASLNVKGMRVRTARLLSGAALVFLALLMAIPAASAATQGDGESVRGTIRQDPEEEGGEPTPVEGVTITVSTEAGEEVEVATSGPDGTFEVALPGPGNYTASIDISTLPEGVQLRNPEQEQLAFQIRPGQARTLIFPLGEGAAVAGGARLGLVLQLLFEGLNFGLIIAICGIGLSLIFGTTGLTNFAHGELVTFGALATWYLNVGAGIELIPAAILGIVIGAAGAGGLDLALWRPLRKRRTGLIAMLVISIGLSLLLRYIFLFEFGGRTAPYNDYVLQEPLRLGLLNVSPRDLVSMAISVAVLVGVGILLQRTRIGKAMRAVADNKDLAESSGINTERVVLFVWVLGGGLAALGGVLLGVGQQVGWQMGFQLLLFMFAGITLGGIGTAYGALVGSLIIGVMWGLAGLFVPEDLLVVVALAVLIVVLLFRPQGILGAAERVG
jgi:neutral amino acid transport system permease protein